MPANGGYKCSDGSYFNSRCEFFCSPGFSLKGQKTTTCQHNKRWSVEVPTCVGKTTKGLEKCLHVVVFEKSIDSHRYKCTPSSVLQSSWSNLYLNEGRWEHDFSSPSYKKKNMFYLCFKCFTVHLLTHSWATRPPVLYKCQLNGVTTLVNFWQSEEVHALLQISVQRSSSLFLWKLDFLHSNGTDLFNTWNVSHHLVSQTI